MGRGTVKGPTLGSGNKWPLRPRGRGRGWATRAGLGPVDRAQRSKARTSTGCWLACESMAEPARLKIMARAKSAVLCA